MTYHPLDDLPDDPPSLPGHEIERDRTWAPTLESPGESWCRCSCGEEMDSQASAGGPELSVGELWQSHLDEAAQDEGADCGEAA